VTHAFALSLRCKRFGPYVLLPVSRSCHRARTVWAAVRFSARGPRASNNDCLPSADRRPLGGTRRTLAPTGLALVRDLTPPWQVPTWHHPRVWQAPGTRKRFFNRRRCAACASTPAGPSPPALGLVSPGGTGRQIR
jgi:hypothetical protein